jgi:nucleoside-diphosphate-sugar epimerase
MQTAEHHRIPAGARVLVTGGAGFIGRQLCRRLSALNLALHATSRHDRPRPAGRPLWWQADMADLDAARRVFSEVKPDIVFHLSGMTGARVDRELVLPAYHSLATSTVNVLLLASERGCRRVVLFGSLNEPVAAAGQEVLIPGSPYAAAKWVASAYGRMFHALYGTPVVNLRPFMAYGPGQARDKLIPSVTLSLLEGMSPRLSSGRGRWDWVYIDDVVEAAIIAAATPGIDGQSFDIGTGTLVSQRALVEQLVAVIGTSILPEFGALPDRPREQERVADTGPALERLGWRATTSLEDGLRKTVAWYRANSEADREPATEGANGTVTPPLSS